MNDNLALERQGKRLVGQNCCHHEAESCEKDPFHWSECKQLILHLDLDRYLYLDHCPQDHRTNDVE